MIFNTIIRKIFKNRTQKLLDNYSLNRTLIHKKIQTIGVLTTDTFLEDSNYKDELSTLFQTSTIQFIKFRKFKKKQFKDESYFTNKDIGIQATINGNHIKQFTKQPFDLLIGYFTEKNTWLELAMMHSKATFKVGFSEVNPIIFDMEITGNKHNLDKFNIELVRYLKILKKID